MKNLKLEEIKLWYNEIIGKVGRVKHWEGCWKVHSECSMMELLRIIDDKDIQIAKLKKQINGLRKELKQLNELGKEYGER